MFIQSKSLGLGTASLTRNKSFKNENFVQQTESYDIYSYITCLVYKRKKTSTSVVVFIVVGKDIVVCNIPIAEHQSRQKKYNNMIYIVPVLYDYFPRRASP